jgi:hypothetical protein
MHANDADHTRPHLLIKISPFLDDAWLRARGLEESSGFSFLNLGLLAYKDKL